MNPNARLNLYSSSASCCSSAQSARPFPTAFGGRPSRNIGRLLEEDTLKPATKAGDRIISECLGVTDFYSVHLTTYFLSDSDESAGGAVDDLSRYDEYCDRVPGTGSHLRLTLMEKEGATSDSPWPSINRTTAGRGGDLLLAFNAHPSGLMSVDATVARKREISAQGRLRRSEEKEDTIEMPILVGQVITPAAPRPALPPPAQKARHKQGERREADEQRADGRGRRRPRRCGSGTAIRGISPP